MATPIADLLAEVVWRVSPDSADTTYQDRVISRFNWSLLETVRFLEPEQFEEIYTGAFGTGITYDGKPTDCLALKSIIIPSKIVDLKPLVTRQWGTVNQTIVGEPRYFFDFNKKLYWHPIPGDDQDGLPYQIFYIRQPDPIGISDDSPLPEWYDEIIVQGATYKFLRDRNEFERAQAAFEELKRVVAGLQKKRALEFKNWGGRSLGVGRRA